VLGLIGLALVVQGVSAQETPEADEERTRVRTVAPNTFTFQTNAGTYLGVFIREVTDDDVSRLDLREERGALVTDVPDDGPASEAGLEADDVVVSWNGTRIESAAQLSRMVRETPAGRTIDLGYMRDGRERTVSVELATRSPMVARTLMPQMEEARGRLEGLQERLGELHRVPAPGNGEGFRFFMRGGRLGVGIQNLGDQLAEYFGADDGGVLVTSVSEDSPAEAAGLRAGDVIIAIDGDRVEDPGDLLEAISEADEGEIAIRVLRDRNDRTLRAILPEREEHSGNAFYFGPQAMQLDLPFGDAPFVLDWNGEELMNIRIPDLHFDFSIPEIAIPEFDIHVEPHGDTEHAVST
jgi:predicted metalloprotease with PDZ domain